MGDGQKRLRTLALLMRRPLGIDPYFSEIGHHQFLLGRPCKLQSRRRNLLLWRSYRNPDLIQASPCIIIDNDDYWSFNETINIQENGIDICQTTCRLDITIVYKNIEVKGPESIELN